MNYTDIIAAYADYEPYELDTMQIHLLSKLNASDPLPAFEEMINILKNEFYGTFTLINNRLYYVLSIKIRTVTVYEYVDHTGSKSRLEAEKIDAIRYRIEPIAVVMNTVLSKLTPNQSFLLYNAYIRRFECDGYQLRSLKQALRKLLNRLNQR